VNQGVQKKYLFAIILIANYVIFSTAVAQNSPISTVSSCLGDSAPACAKRYQACTTCHGAGNTATVGRTANEQYFPRIAGKPAAYLYNQLRHYRDGGRHYGLMVGLVEHQSDAALLAMAQYFANLELPYPEPASLPSLRAGTGAASLQRGQQLALHGDKAQGIAACVSCHGAQLSGALPAIPGLLGLPRDYIAGQIGAWHTGQRKAQAPDCMAVVAKQLRAEDVSAVATWLSTQRLPAEYKAVKLRAPLPTACGDMK
jgi:cytochrome c553